MAEASSGLIRVRAKARAVAAGGARSSGDRIVHEPDAIEARGKQGKTR